MINSTLSEMNQQFWWIRAALSTLQFIKSIYFIKCYKVELKRLNENYEKKPRIDSILGFSGIYKSRPTKIS